MPLYSFEECRDVLRIGEGFDDTNVIDSPVPPDKLPPLRIERQRPVSQTLSRCQIRLGKAAGVGTLTINLGADDTVVEIGAHTRLNGLLSLWQDSSIRIGDFTTMNQARIVAERSTVDIGADCLFSDEILIQSSDQHGLINLDTMEFINAGPRRIVIGDHVWIGRRATVMPDVRIGDGAVIGAGSVVTSDVAHGAIAAGVPARTVRTGASWTRRPNQINDREAAFFARMRGEPPV